MRTSHVATALAAFTAGLTAAAALRRLTGLRISVTVAAAALPSDARASNRGAVVLPFTRPAAADPAPTQPASPARCGDTGGRTKAGAPCGARSATGGRCHHHPLAA